MPLRGIVFPNGKIYEREDIEMLRLITMGEQPGTLPHNLPAPITYLEKMFRTREWDGKPHVTDLLRGVRQTYLEYTHPYSQTVDQLAYSVLGVSSHAGLEGQGSEVEFEQDGIQGRVDILERSGVGYRLTDIKTQGSYAVAKALGVVAEEKQITDDNGNPLYYKTGKKAGEPKTKKSYYTDPARQNFGDTQWQLTIYALLLSKTGRLVNDTWVFYIVRDGGTAAAMSRGVTERTYYLQVPMLAPANTMDFVLNRRDRILKIIDSDTMPEPCTPEEAWYGNRCKSYCPVAKWCVAHGDNPYIKQEDITW